MSVRVFVHVLDSVRLIQTNGARLTALAEYQPPTCPVTQRTLKSAAD